MIIYSKINLTSPFGETVEQITMTSENGITSFIPADPANADYQTYLKWLEEQNG
jgi:hypothetical protein